MDVEKYNDIMENLEAYTTANNSSITDFNKGSVIHTIYSSIARVIERFYMDVRNAFANSLKQVAYSIFGIERKSGTKATTTVVFSRSKSTSFSVTIYAGTKISDGTHIFTTSETAVIPENELDSNEVSAQAAEVGSEYNLEIGKITTLESIVSSEVTSVTNVARADNGSDKETDAALYSRFKAYINGLQGNNVYGLKSAVLGVDGVRSVAVDEHFGTLEEGVYNATIYVDDGSGNMTQDLKDAITTVIEGDGTSVNPGKRAAGINIRILPATRVLINIAGTVKVYRTEVAQATADIKECFENQINGLGINENVVLTSLILALRNISYIKDVNGLTINGSTDNITISKKQIARLGTINIDVEDWSND